MTIHWDVVEEHGSTAPAGFLHLVHRTFRIPDGSSTLWDLLGGRNSVAVLIAEPCPDYGEFVAPTLVTLDDLRKLLRSGQMTDVDLGYMALDSLGLL